MATGNSFVDKFVCTNSQCSYNCCGGWQIEIDEETYHKYLHEPGEFGKELRKNMRFTNVAQIKQRFHRCPYLTKDRLCGMYLTHGEEYMSFACRIFPRRQIAFVNQGRIIQEETYLELSCPEAARLFLAEKGALVYEKIERETETCWNFEVEEQNYYEVLLRMREAIGCIINRRDIDLFYAMMLVYDYVAECQQLSMRLKYDEIFSYTEVYLTEKNLIAKLKEYMNYQVDLSSKGSLLHTFVSEGVEQIDIKVTNKGMAKYLRLYYWYFHNNNFSKMGQRVFTQQRKMLHKQKELEQHYRNYFEYYMHQRLMYAIQSYNMTKAVIMGLVHTQMLILFDLLGWWKGGEKLSTENEINILAYYSRTAGHNESICDKIYEFIVKSGDMRGMLLDLIM